MKLYDSIGPNPRVVRMALAEKGMAIETVAVDLLRGENRGEAHTARNPTGHTPSLELEDGAHLSEIIPIVEYLEERRPEPPLVGSTPEQRAEARMWTRRIDLYVAEPLIIGFRGGRARAFFAPRMRVVAEAAAAELVDHAVDRLRWLDGQLAGREWVCGARLTMADLLLFAFADFAREQRMLPGGFGWLPGWMERMAARPSASA